MSQVLTIDTVLMPVPLRFAEQVFDLIKALSTGNTTTDEETIRVPDNGDWSQSMIQRLVAEVDYPAVLELLDLCAASKGEWIDKAHAEQNADVSPYQLRNELGAFSKRTRRMFGEVVWPMQYKRERGKYTYRLDPTIANWWIAARKASR
jgi:hypothetical protein